jgi:hypothetical protein
VSWRPFCHWHGFDTLVGISVLCIGIQHKCILRDGECRDYLNVMLSVIMLDDVMLSVVAPFSA